MKNSTLKSSIFFCLIILLFGCSNKKTNEKIEEDDQIEESKIPQFEIRNVKDALGDCANFPIEKCMEVTISYPKITKANTVFEEAYNYFLQDYFNDFLSLEKPIKSELVEDFLTESIAEQKEKIQQSESDFPAAFELDINIKPIFSNENLSSFSWTYTSYAGGAHPNSGKGFVVFENQTGKEVHRDVIVKDQTFKEVILKKLKEGKEQDLEELGFLMSDEEFEISNNFGITNDSLFITYSPYEIAPYAMGFYELEFSKEEVKDYFSPEFIALWE